MRPGSVEVAYISVEYPLKLLLMQDEQMIEAFTSYTAEETFTDSICTWGVIRSFENLHVTRLRNPSEAHPKLAVVITDEVLRPHTKGGGFPKLLCSPSVSGRSCHADMDYFARVQFDNEEGKQRAKEEISDWKRRRRPRFLWQDGARRWTSSVLVAWQCAPVACISGSFVCRREDPA